MIDEYLNVEPLAEPIESIAKREWRHGSFWRDFATTLPFTSPAEAEVAGARLMADLIATIDTRGLKTWTNVFECDDCEVNKVAVKDDYGTCAIVFCADCNGGTAIAGPCDSPYGWEDEEDDRDAAMVETYEEPEELTPEEEERFEQYLRDGRKPLIRFIRWIQKFRRRFVCWKRYGRNRWAR